MTDYRLPPLDGGERLYRALLCVYPARFRRAFGQDLVETFRDQRRDARRHGVPAMAFWLETAHDLLAHGCAERGSTALRTLRRIRGTHEEESPMAALPHALRLTELRYAMRRLVRVPTFTATTVLVLALGIGATTAVFTIVNGVLIRPLPYPHPERLVSLTHTLEVAGVGKVDQSEATFLLYERRARAFSGVAVDREGNVNLTARDGDPLGAERVASAEVSASFFPTLGVAPLIGRTFRSGEDRVGAAPVAILSQQLWQRRFAGSREILGAHVTIDGLSREIVGVMPGDFGYPTAQTDVWLPLRLDPLHAAVGSFNYRGVARLRDGITLDAARADLARVLPRLLDEFPSEIPRAMWEQARVAPVVRPLRDAIVGDVSRLLWILLGSVALVLLIACANVANLFLVRGEARQRELAVRGALGAGLTGIVAQCLSEALVLAAIGGALGLALAVAGVSLTTHLGAQLGVPRLEEIVIDRRVVLFAMVVAAACAAFVSLIPVLRARRIPIASVLRESGRSATSGKPRQRARSALVVAQVALALVLVAASGLLARSFARLRDVRPGFDPTNVTMARIALPWPSYPSGDVALRVYDRLLGEVRALPGVRDATIVSMVPLTSDHDDTTIGVEDHPLPPGTVPRVHIVPEVDAHWFGAFGPQLLAGRTFSPYDASRPPLEAIVSRAFAERYWPNAGPIGKRIRPGIDGPWYTIVGEASDVHFASLDQPAEDAAYFPLMQTGGGPNAGDYHYVPHTVTLLVRSEGNDNGVESAVRRVVRAIDPALPTYDEGPLTRVVDAASARARMVLGLLAIASALALVLGAVGIYGVMAYGVTLRQREIGVRLALGARPADVRSMISRQGLALGVMGVAIGVACALGVTRLLRGLLYDVSPTDPVVLIGTCVVLVGMSLMASWIPALRAAAVDPAEALRRE